MKRRIEFTYDLDTFRGDLFGGITSTVVALPVSLAFGVASGLGAAAGLYGAIAVGFFAGPTAPMAVDAAVGGPFERAVELGVVLVHHSVGAQIDEGPRRAVVRLEDVRVERGDTQVDAVSDTVVHVPSVPNPEHHDP